MTPEQSKELLKLLGQSKSEMQEWYELQKDINSGMDGYIDGVRQVSELSKDLKTIKSNIKELQKDQNKLSGKELKLSKQKIAYLELEYSKIEKNRDAVKQAIKESNKWSMAAGAAGAATLKAASNLDKLPNFITGKLGILKGLFEMDKAIRTTVTQMGTLGKQSDIVRQNIKAAAVNTISFGAGIKEIAEIQAQYTESLGRNVMLSQKSLETIAEIGKSTGLGIEGATEMAVQFDKMGVSAEMAGKFTQEALDRSSSMGLNATKVMKNINQNFKMLNKYRFKEGIKGLIKMAELSTKLGVDMDFASSMADKLFSVEGAVEMAAQLNVMGGAWAQMADPFKLMYQARNDMQGLTDDISKAAASSMSFAQDGSIQTNAMEMQRLRIVAEQTGLEYEKLVELGKTKFKFDKIEMQSAGLTDEMKTFLANTAEFKDGKAYIQLEGGKKLLTRLNQTDKDFIQTQINEKETMKKRAEAAQSFDEKFQNLINMVEITMLPIIEGLTKALDPLVTKLMNGEFKDDLIKLGENIGTFVEWAAKGLGSFVSTVVDIFGAKGLFYTYLVGKTALWLANGYLLAKGFMAGVGPFMNSMGGKGGPATTGGGKNPINPATGKPFRGRPPAGGFQPSNSGKFGKFGKLSGGMSFGKSLARGAGVGAIGGLASMGLEYGRGQMDDPESTGGKLMGAGAKAAEWASYGALIGSVIPGLGTGAGAIVGGLLGGGKGIYDEFFGEPQEDAMFPKLGSSHSKGRGIIQGGKITPINNKDDVLAMKPGGMIDKTLAGVNNNKPLLNKIEFGELRITGEIKVSLPDGSNIGQDLMKSQEFKTSITRVVQSQLEKNNNGGKNGG
jgi:hypothetical protein